RGVAADTNREEDGRLFTNIPTGRLISLFEGLGAKAIFNEEQQEENREDVIWHNLVFEKIDTSRKDGIDRIQEILIKDKKTSTYKLALLRGLNYLARHENGIAKYDYDREYVWLPMKRVAFTWIRYYFPLLKRDNPFRQITSAPNLAIQKLFTENLSQYQSTDLSLLIDEYEDGRNRDLVDVVLKEISKTIKTQPVKYTTSDSSEVFKIISKEDASLFHEMDYEAGAIGVPVSIWHDLMLFGSWIDDSLYIQWANFIKNIEKDRNFGEILSALMEPTDDKRSTLQIHKLFKGQTVECIWSGEQISKFDIDHAIPYSLWKNNDLWNLLPCDSSLNSSKTNKLPSLQLLNKRKDCIISYWEIYQKMYPEQFAYQLSKSLGSNIKNDNWKNKSHLNLLETISRLSVHKIGDTWDYI
ncbi:MAG: hypothetical protein KAG61_13085, partial [Bacteriovoracaceae bacterium]|nr:hypothetical protein [Bacteriovoracaceae bacterium]